MTADSSATIGLPLSSACVTSAEIVNGATCRSYVGIFITPAGVAELVQAHGLGPCGVSRWRFESSRPHVFNRRGLAERSTPLGHAWVTKSGRTLRAGSARLGSARYGP